MYYEDLFVENEIVSPNKSNKLNNAKCSYYEIKTVNRDNLPIKKKLYISGPYGSSIRDALTGVLNFNHKVGTKDENNYYKVKLSIGSTSEGPLTFFFSSKEEYNRNVCPFLEK
jgi:hypothetical protein